MLAVVAALSLFASPTIAIEHVTVIDGVSKRPIKNVTVLIQAGKFSQIGAKVSIPAEAKRIDGQGKFLIPGLWDMHTHWYDQTTLPLFTANGVTGIRVMHGMTMHLKWRDADQPHIYAGSPIVDGPKPIWPGSVACKDAEAGRKAVDTVQTAGYDFVKVYSLLPRDAYFGIAEQAKKKGIVFQGHVPNLIRMSEAIDAGQKCGEHLYGVAAATSTQEDAIMESRAAGDAKTVERGLLDGTHDPAKAVALYKKMAAAGMAQCPTLVVLHALSQLDKPEFRRDPRTEYMPKSIVAGWDPTKDFRLKAWKEADWDWQRTSFANSLKLVKELHDHGVTILAGTDCLNPYCFPGFSLHDELALLVQAGLTPLQAIQCATTEAARFMKRDDIGSIRVGKVADFVLLTADPLRDIHNTTKIAAVGQGPSFYDRSALDQMLVDMKKRAGGVSGAAGFFDVD